MHLEIITPETKIFSGKVEAVQFPGIDGLFQILNNHAPIISALDHGVIKIDLLEAFIKTEDSSNLIEEDINPKIIRVGIKGGVVEMLNNKVIVLAE
jgi:F-type H+-transporting ATPase subunit epsilon